MKLLTFLTVLLLIPITWGSASAQEKPNNIIFGGVLYDDASVWACKLGVGAPLGAGLWSFTHASVGEVGSLEEEIAYLLGTKENGFYAGPIAGPGADWTNSGGLTEDPIVYITGAGGLIVGYDLGIRTGLWAFGKWKFAFDNLDGAQTLFRDGWRIGAGGYWRF